MSLINMAKREINCKIVYYGIGLCGKTTNLHYIHKAVNPQDVGDMVSIDTETERTLYFDLLPLELGKVHGFQIRFQLYTVPGQFSINKRAFRCSKVQTALFSSQTHKPVSSKRTSNVGTNCKSNCAA